MGGPSRHYYEQSVANIATCPCCLVPAHREEKDVNCADKVTEHVTIYTLQGDTPQLVDDFVAAAYDSYRAMLKGEQKDKTVER